MKRSTRLIIIALIAAAVTMTAKCIYDILTAFRFPDYEISDANPVTIELQRFNRIDIVTLQPKPEINLTPRIYKGVVIEESDSVTTPVMKTSLEWSRIITPEIKDSVLTLSFDFSVSYDSINLPDGVFCIIESASPKPVKICVPRRMVKEASTDQYNIYFDKFKGGSIKADVCRTNTYIRDYEYKFHKRYPGWLMVNDGWLDTIVCKNPLEGLRLEKATVGEAHVPMGNIHLTVVSKQPGDSVNNLFITPADGTFKSGELDLSKTNIGTLYIPPHDSTNFVLNLSIDQPVTIKEYR
ncbi:MAG: hypothetical protein K2G47_07505 [Muribaculum sp.]|nr:hypothetical protein [Muribaculum sp.]